MTKQLAISEVIELFDVTILHDIESLSLESEDISCRSMVALGWHGELAAGLRYGELTPWFPTVDDLEAFCQANIIKFREAAKASDDGAPAPNAANWI